MMNPIFRYWYSKAIKQSSTQYALIILLFLDAKAFLHFLTCVNNKNLEKKL